MVGLLGMLAAGAAVGARDASNASVRAQNELEIGNAREMLREEFLNRRFDRELGMMKENAKAQAARDELKYQREVEDKKEQRKHEMDKAGLLNQGRITSANIRESGANARHRERMAMEKQGSGKGAASNEDLYVTLKDGRKYLPQTPMEKKARAIFIAGRATSYEDAMKGLMETELLRPAISANVETLTSADAVGHAGSMVDKLYGGGQQQKQGVLKWNPTKGAFE
mgnify:FL=1